MPTLRRPHACCDSRDQPISTTPRLAYVQMRGYFHRLEILAEECTKADIEGFLEDIVFPKSLDSAYRRSAGLESAKSFLMSSHLIPNNPESLFRVS
jgi:hypothetical protein